VRSAVVLCPLLVVLLASGGGGCGLRVHWKPYDAPLRTTDEISDEIALACQRSLQDQQPVLLEFGARWCSPPSYPMV
jgi:hypothetical protein